jgi:LPS-assembly protein
VTTCDGDNPDWRITGKDLKVTIEGYGFAKHSTFWAKQIPVIYTPYLVFPVKLKRQSGLLAPDFGLSDRKGFAYLQPFFWAISDSTDATFFADYMAERGVRAGVEYRYVAGDRARGTFMADGFDDRRVDDGQLDHSERWGYTDDPYLRTNNGRYWLRGKIDQNLPLNMTAKVDLDVVSDQDYLHEFKSGFNGFNETQNYFLETFGRDVDDYTAQFRENQLNINRLWSRYAFNADVRWYHDAVRSRPDNSATPYQNLPELSFDGIKQKIFGSPVYYDLLSSYTHFYREQGATGQRIDMYPRVYYPTRLFNAVSVEPSAGVRQTAWHMDRHNSAAMDLDTDTYRAIYDLKLDTSTDFYRVFDFEKGGVERIKHTIRPQIVYHYIPDTDQTEYPYFDSLDRIQARNLVTFALTNNLIARKPHTGAPSEGPDAVYIPFLRFRVEQGLDLDKVNSDEPHPWTDLLAELDIMPGRYIRLDSDALLDPYDGRLNAFNTALRLWDARGDWISIDYRYTRETEERSKINSIITEAAWQVTHQWQLRARYERDIAGGAFEESGFGVTYQSQCWGIDVDYALEEDNNSSISARVRLTGLGNIGQ